jgi:DNA repair exonuclease SbcCD ATPase subunit
MVVASEAGARQAQAGQGKTAAELESTRQAWLVAEKERGQQQSLVKEAGQKLEGLQRDAKAAAELLESRQQAVVSAGDAFGKLQLQTEALRRNRIVDQAEWDRRAAALRDQQADLETLREATLTQRQELEAACQDLAGTQQQIKDAGVRLSQLNQAVAEAEAAATLRQQELDRNLREGESRWQELESQAAEYRRQIAQQPPVPAGPGPATNPDAARPEEIPGNPTEPAGSIEDELIRLGFRVQPVKKNPGHAK